MKKKRKKRNSTATSSNKNYIYDYLNIFHREIITKSVSYLTDNINNIKNLFVSSYLILFFPFPFFFPFSMVVKTSQLLAN